MKKGVSSLVVVLIVGGLLLASGKLFATQQCNTDSDCCDLYPGKYVDCRSNYCYFRSDYISGYLLCDGGTTTTTTQTTTTTTQSDLWCTPDNPRFKKGEIIETHCDEGYYFLCGSDKAIHTCFRESSYSECNYDSVCGVSICREQSQSCLTSIECCRDLVCKNGVCQPPESACGDEGDPCSSNNECCIGFSCEPYLWYKTCQVIHERTGCEIWCTEDYCFMKDLCGKCNFCQGYVPDDTTCEWQGVTYHDGEVIIKFCEQGYYIICDLGQIHSVSKQSNPERFKQICPNIDCRVQSESCGPLQECCEGLVCEPPLGGVCQPNDGVCLAEGRNCDENSPPCCTSLKCLPYLTWYRCQKEEVCNNIWIDKIHNALDVSCTTAWIVVIGVVAFIFLFVIKGSSSKPQIIVMKQ